MYQRILLAVDGSGTADHALLEAAKIAGGTAIVHAVCIADVTSNAIPIPYLLDYDSAAVRSAVTEYTKGALARAETQLKEKGARVETELLCLGDDGVGISVAEAILAAAGRSKADLIVMGTHGRRGLRRVLLGSVAEEVVRTANVPVLLVRSPSPSALSALNPAEVYKEWPEDEVLGG